MLIEVDGAAEQARDQQEPWFDASRRPALLALLALLDARDYDFVTPTPGTHTRVLRRRTPAEARDVRDVLGWSLPFVRGTLEHDLVTALEAAGALRDVGGGRHAPLLRATRVEGRLFLHSAFPTLAQDVVFLGPDSYRFAQLIAARIAPGVASILDYGAGAGVGGITAAAIARDAHLTLADINPKALFLAGINAEHAGVRHDTILAGAPQEIDRRFDLIVTHPPFMIDAESRAYRDGGDLYGARLSLEWVVQGARMLAPRGQLILHTGVSIVDGRDVLLDALHARLPAQEVTMEYRELDPDIFSEDLDQPGYAGVDRIAAVGAVIRRGEPG